MRVQGKVCVVTGGAVGLGKADAVLLASHGARVVITDVDSQRGEEAAHGIGADAIFMRHDVRDEERWSEVVAGAVSHFGRLDVLVNNAGVVEFLDIDKFTSRDWRFVFDTSAIGAVLGCKHAIPAIHQSRGGGSIINMSSTASLVGMPLIPAYSSAKGALRALTRQVAAHCRHRGYDIRCNALHPTSMDTPMVEGAMAARRRLFPEGSEEAGRRTKSGSPAEVAHAVLYLASDESRPVNGSAIVIDRATTIMEGKAP